MKRSSRGQPITPNLAIGRRLGHQRRGVWLLRIAFADLVLLAIYGCITWAAYWFASGRGLPGYLLWPFTIAVFLLGVGAYAQQAVPWWRRVVLNRERT